MTYWRMQLHPNQPDQAVYHAANSVCRGVIGLDFDSDIGDLRGNHSPIESGHKDYRLFESEMKVGDLVLVQAHHQPFALVEVASDYAYVPNAKEAYGVWFRHLRLIRNPKFYADWITNPQDWQSITMTDTIAPLRSEDSLSYGLIDRWRGGL